MDGEEKKGKEKGSRNPDSKTKEETKKKREKLLCIAAKN
jgi:hypothetical protein